MDLQDSLTMLEKFQTASRSMRVSNKKRRPEGCERSPDTSGFRGALSEASNAKKMVGRSASSGLDGELTNSTDELKRVIKDSFYRKNILSAYELHREFIQVDGPSTEHSATPSDESCQSVVDWDTEPSIDGKER
ncbi:hypothetical protein OsI_00991 [Oryza sativa Indica Group]|uniref:Uncharacterized protein n=1 Tax=Oryza sativa subsp. indica TaxID=39946 RepID=A2WMC1_ORYSI|nr:hypothetical protein OsI_00991 [Oryza sativa Indica Group]